MRSKLIVLLFIGLLQSCFSDTPSNYFNKSTLNTNKLTRFGTKDLEGFVTNKERNMLTAKFENGEWGTQDKVVLHLTSYLIPDIEKDLQNIKNLKPTDETRAMLDASIGLYEFTLDKYRTDYMTIAELIDSNASKEDIAIAISIFEKENVENFWSLHTKLTEIAIPYAEANAIEVSRY